MRPLFSSFVLMAAMCLGGCDAISPINRTPSITGLGGAVGAANTGTGGSGNLGVGGQAGNGTSGLPCEVQSILDKYCASCHGAPPSGGAPRSLTTYTDLMRTDVSNSSINEAQAAMQRIQSKSAPMPPSAPAPTSDEIATLQNWISDGYPKGSCVSSSGGGSGGTSQAGGNGSSGSGGSSQAGVGGTREIADTGVPGGSLPCDVQTLMANRCTSCHGSTPSGGAPRSLVTYDNLASPDLADPSMTEAQVALQRMQSTDSPMPPSPALPATSAEIATLENWISRGYPSGSCGDDAGVPPEDPLNAQPTCTSNKNWTQGTNGSPSMEPGQACISCHSTNRDAPSFVIAGTLYPTGHEPDNCNGVNGTNAGAKVVVSGSNGTSVTLTPNAAGNFYSTTSLPPPYQAKVVNASGIERMMFGTAANGDCNSCHTQNGANDAPGRITLP